MDTTCGNCQRVTRLIAYHPATDQQLCRDCLEHWQREQRRGRHNRRSSLQRLTYSKPYRNPFVGI